MPYYPHKNKDRILIINDGQDCGAPYGPLFHSLGEVCHDKAALKLTPFSFKLMVFTGGADVSPELYGDTSPERICRANPERDREEEKLFKFGQQRGIKMIGICRGMQFLNIMTGGKMMHDITGHASGAHKVAVKSCTEPFVTNTYHHQMCVPHKSTHILAWSHVRLSSCYIGDEDATVNYRGPEVEAIYMPWLKAVGVQWHPEVSMQSNDWFNHLLRDLLDKVPLEFKRKYLGPEYLSINITEV